MVRGNASRAWAKRVRWMGNVPANIVQMGSVVMSNVESIANRAMCKEALEFARMFPPNKPMGRA